MTEQQRYQRPTVANIEIEYEDNGLIDNEYESDDDVPFAQYVNPQPQTPQREVAPPPRQTAPRATPLKHEEDKELFPGVFQSDVTSWNKQFNEVYYAEIKGQPFIFRALERFEYKEIVGTPNTDPLMREEMMCEYCVLYPSNYIFSTMSNQKAGYPAVLSELIMDYSGFTRDVVVTKL